MTSHRRKARARRRSKQLVHRAQHAIRRALRKELISVSPEGCRRARELAENVLSRLKLDPMPYQVSVRQDPTDPTRYLAEATVGRWVVAEALNQVDRQDLQQLGETVADGFVDQVSTASAAVRLLELNTSGSVITRVRSDNRLSTIASCSRTNRPVPRG